MRSVALFHDRVTTGATASCTVAFAMPSYALMTRAATLPQACQIEKMAVELAIPGAVDQAALINRVLFDADVADAAKAVACPHIGELRHLPELTARNGRTIERIAPSASGSREDAQFSSRLEFGLQLVAGQALRANGRRSLLSVSRNGTTRGRDLPSLTVARRRQQEGRPSKTGHKKPALGRRCE